MATRRVLHVINGEHYSGAERVQDLLAQELPQVGFEVGFACLKPDRFPLARHAQEAPLHNTPMRWRFDMRCVEKLVQLIRQEGYALVHAHTPRSVWVGSLAARRAQVPLVYHVHSPTAQDSTRPIQNWVNARLERWSIRDASRLIAVSPSLKRLMQEQGFDAERVTYVPNGVPSQSPTKRQRPSGTWTLGIAALFRPRKGIEVLLESLAMLRSRGIDVRLRAVGPFETPEYEAETQELVERLGIGPSITWTGFVGDMPAELQQMDIMVLPSLFGEGLPMVILEAMAAGVPVVASHVEGVPEAIVHRDNGLLVEPASVSQLASAIEEIIQGDELDYVQLSENAVQRHAECFSAQAMAAGVAEVYREVLSTSLTVASSLAN
ncbi:MAG: glycosyltransferase family 4 protein [Planctomycetes bacterium]|nr:glycosyltransferase family 4 protein [Planctomycetota bacterium]